MVAAGATARNEEVTIGPVLRGQTHNLSDEQGAEVKRPSARRWLITGVAVTLVAALVAHVVLSYPDLAHFRRLSATDLVITLVLQFLAQLVFNEAMLLPLRPYVKGLGYWEFFIVRTGGFVAGTVVPVAGNIAVRLAYLRRRGLTYLEFTWATILSNVLALVAAAVLAVLATGVLWIRSGVPPRAVLALAAGVLAASVVALAGLYVVPRVAGHASFRKWPWVAEVSAFDASRRTTAWIFVLSFARHAFNFMTFGILYQGLSGQAGDRLAGGLIYALTSPVRMINITPGNLGVNEWVVALAGKALAFDVATGLVVALLFRGIALVAQGLGVLFGWAWVARRNGGVIA